MHQYKKKTLRVINLAIAVPQTQEELVHSQAHLYFNEMVCCYSRKTALHSNEDTEGICICI